MTARNSCLSVKLVAVHAIVRLEQPAATALPDVVQGVARGALHDLQQVRLRVRADDVAKRPRHRNLLHEPARPPSREQTIRNLLEGAAGARAIAKEHADPEHALEAHGGDFDEPAVPHLVVTENTPPLGKYTSLIRVPCSCSVSPVGRSSCAGALWIRS